MPVNWRGTMICKFRGLPCFSRPVHDMTGAHNGRFM